MPRLFTGLELPAEVAFELELMRGGIPGASWIDRQSYHITLRFVGDIEDRQASELAAELEAVRAEPFAARLKGIDAFGGNKPHTLYAGIEENQEVRRLQAAHERICQLVGLPPEPRRFTPHVTLARLNNPSLPELHRYLAAHSLYRSQPFTISRFVLFSSRPMRGGGPYAVEEAYAL